MFSFLFPDTKWTLFFSVFYRNGDHLQYSHSSHTLHVYVKKKKQQKNRFINV